MTTTTSGTTSDVWTVDNSSSKAKYTLNRDSWNYVLGDELRDANGNAVAEAQGLGFSAVRGSGSTLVYRTGDDIQFRYSSRYHSYPDGAYGQQSVHADQRRK